ncbi:DUF3306 domain-containing protein [Belnapia rosea]|uniref:DUF3306 domain-containing protein n=1 Tax=Belnapia rosea TaxID=938405 RepID=UPI000886A147|nr:DUF3306 domain-containing protein [Belnapia rosea]SDB70228.1 Protein of unknown function [Belnapia rosea]
MSGEGFLGRWSRRKREAAQGAPEPAEPMPLAPPAAAPPETVSPPEAPAFDPASLPPVESLTQASDFTAYLRAEVPAALRKAALRKAWTLDPGIRDFVGPADYAWDYNAPDGVPGFAHVLGGDLKQLLAQAIGALEEAVAPEETEAPAAEPGPEPGAGQGLEPDVSPGTVLAEAPALPDEAPALPPEPSISEILPSDPVPTSSSRRRHGGAAPV